jgi:hypothetical protein
MQRAAIEAAVQHQRDHFQPQRMHIPSFGWSDILGMDMGHGSNVLGFCVHKSLILTSMVRSEMPKIPDLFLTVSPLVLRELSIFTIYSCTFGKSVVIGIMLDLRSLFMGSSITIME